MRELPVLFDRQEECCGCTACLAVCPMQAITMEADLEGFDYPTINEQKCIKCYSCIEVCPLKS